MSVQVISPGLFTSIQDMGRTGFAAYGVPMSGVMDSYASKIANLLVRNSKDKAVMEITIQGPKLKFLQNAFIVLTGLEAVITLNNQPVYLNKAFSVCKNDCLNIKQVTKGTRIYMAVKGGFLTKKVLGSRSFYKNITFSEKLKLNDVLPIEKTQPKAANDLASIKFKKSKYDSSVLKVYKGPEWGKLSKKLKDKILNQNFTISKNNSRMAYQLNEKFENHLPSIITQPVLPGTVQITPAGNIIVLMRDCQTTGGYPRILQLDEESINRLAQKRMNAAVEFELMEYP